MAKPLILVSNDDGITAPGIRHLIEVMAKIGDVVVVAPDGPQSGMGHAVTIGNTLRLNDIDIYDNADANSCSGTPADCVRVALHQFRGEFDCVLAGINSGGNLGADVFHSGTVAAIREGALHGLPGIAVSHYRNRTLTPEDWSRAARWVRPIVENLLSRNGASSNLWSINLPCLDPDAEAPEAVECEIDLSPHDLQFRDEYGKLQYCGSYQKRPRKPGTDIDVCFGGRIAVTPLRLTA